MDEIQSVSLALKVRLNGQKRMQLRYWCLLRCSCSGSLAEQFMVKKKDTTVEVSPGVHTIRVICKHRSFLKADDQHKASLVYCAFIFCHYFFHHLNKISRHCIIATCWVVYQPVDFVVDGFDLVSFHSSVYRQSSFNCRKMRMPKHGTCIGIFGQFWKQYGCLEKIGWCLDRNI